MNETLKFGIEPELLAEVDLFRAICNDENNHIPTPQELGAVTAFSDALFSYDNEALDIVAQFFEPGEDGLTTISEAEIQLHDYVCQTSSV